MSVSFLNGSNANGGGGVSPNNNNNKNSSSSSRRQSHRRRPKGIQLPDPTPEEIAEEKRRYFRMHSSLLEAYDDLGRVRIEIQQLEEYGRIRSEYFDFIMSTIDDEEELQEFLDKKRREAKELAMLLDALKSRGDAAAAATESGEAQKRRLENAETQTNEPQRRDRASQSMAVGNDNNNNNENENNDAATAAERRAARRNNNRLQDAEAKKVPTDKEKEKKSSLNNGAISPAVNGRNGKPSSDVEETMELVPVRQEYMQVVRRRVTQDLGTLVEMEPPATPMMLWWRRWGNLILLFVTGFLLGHMSGVRSIRAAIPRALTQ